MQRLVWDHKMNLKSIDRLSCQGLGCMQPAGPTLQRKDKRIRLQQNNSEKQRSKKKVAKSQQWEKRWRKRDAVEINGVKVRHGNVRAISPSSASPGATGVQLLTSMWTGVSGSANVHQGNETPGLCYGPRCIMGGQKNNSWKQIIEHKRKESFFSVFSSCTVVSVS